MKYFLTLFSLLSLFSNLLYSQHELQDLEIDEMRQEIATYEETAFYIQLKPGFTLGNKKINKSSNYNLNHVPELKSALTNGIIISIDQEFKILSNQYDEIKRIYRIQIADKNLLLEEIAMFSKLDYINYAERIPLYKTSYTPIDPDFSNPSKNWHIYNVNANIAWNYNIGSDTIKIGIVDDAVLTSHEDLQSKIWNNSNEIPNNGIDDDGNGYIDDVNGFDVADNDNNANPPQTVSSSFFSHGTHVAGICGAETDNDLGNASIGFNSMIVPIKTKSNQNLTPGALNNPMQGVEYAIAVGVDVINMSWGSYGSSTSHQMVFNLAFSQGIVSVAAAGNDGFPFMAFPAAYNNVISVGATDQANNLSNYSNYATNIDVYAPGDNIWSTLGSGTDQYGYKSGTSMSAPIVSGIVALMKCNNSLLSPSDIKSCLHNTANFITGPNYIISLVQSDNALLCSAPLINECETNGCQLIKNGGFETTANNNITNYGGFDAIHSSYLCSWMSYAGTSDVYPSDVSEPNHWAQIIATTQLSQQTPVYSEGIISNEMNIIPGEVYILEFDYAVSKRTTAPYNEVDSLTIELIDNSFLYNVLNPMSTTVNTYKLHTISNLPVDYEWTNFTEFFTGSADPFPYFHHYQLEFIAPAAPDKKKILIRVYSSAIYPDFTEISIDNISVKPKIEVTATSSQSVINSGDCVNLSVVGNGDVYKWEPSSLFLDPFNPNQTICADSSSCESIPLVYTATAFDTLIGCYSIDTVSITVLGADHIAPIPNVQNLPDILNDCGIVNYITPPTATDNCSGTLIGTTNQTFPISGIGTVIITWTFEDESGNISTQDQNIIISQTIDNSVSQTGITLTADASGFEYQWIDCDNGNSPILGEINQSFTPSQNGNYAVIISANYCSITSSCITINSVGIDENNNSNQFTYYPNPTNGAITIVTNRECKLKVINYLGDVVLLSNLNSGANTIDLSSYSSGIYYLIIISDNGVDSARISLSK